LDLRAEMGLEIKAIANKRLVKSQQLSEENKGKERIKKDHLP